jgi:hypothetical protein
MTRPRAADDFEIIRARMEELRRERTYTLPPGKDTGAVAETSRSFDMSAVILGGQNRRNDSNTRTGNRREDADLRFDQG